MGKRFSWVEKPITFNFPDVQITCGQEVAFATTTGRCVNIDPNGEREPLEFRLTMGLRKIAVEVFSPTSQGYDERFCKEV